MCGCVWRNNTASQIFPFKGRTDFAHLSIVALAGMNQGRGFKVRVDIRMLSFPSDGLMVQGRDKGAPATTWFTMPKAHEVHLSASSSKYLSPDVP